MVIKIVRLHQSLQFQVQQRRSHLVSQVDLVHPHLREPGDEVDGDLREVVGDADEEDEIVIT